VTYEPGVRSQRHRSRTATRMIVGDGMLARAFHSAFHSDENTLIFASGVSNSQEIGLDAFQRERALLEHALTSDSRRIVYFSSCSVAADTAALTPYLRHKRGMESLVLSSFKGVVIRLPQVVGRTSNPITFANFIRDRVVSGDRFSVWAKAERNLVDVDDVASIGAALVAERDCPRVVAIAAPQSRGVTEIIEVFENVLGKKANYVLEDRGCPLQIDSTYSDEAARRLGIELDGNYLERIVRKYYGSAGPVQRGSHR